MPDPQFQIIRINEWEMRRIFNEGDYQGKVRRGELTEKLRRNTHPSRTEANEPFCTRTQEISYVDAEGKEIVRVHQYVRPDLTLGASGFPDPKRILVGETMYRIIKGVH
jgi:hypothetical protein